MTEPTASSQKLIQAIIKQESAGDPNAKSSAGALGLMQVMPATFKEVAGKLGIKNPDPLNPEHNVAVGERYINDMVGQFGDLKLALAAYNWGPGNVRKALNTHGKSFENIYPYLPRETKQYVTKVIGDLSKA